MNINKISSATNFGNANIPDDLLSHPLIKGSVRAIKKASGDSMVELKSVCLDIFDDIEGIKVSVDSNEPKKLFQQIDIWIRSTKENIKNKAVLKAVQEAVKLAHR